MQMTVLIQTLSSVLLGSGLTTLLSLSYLAQIGIYAPSLALPAFCVVIAQIIATILTLYFTTYYNMQTMEVQAGLSGMVTALLNGIQKIKLAGAEDRAFARWASKYAEYARSAYNRPAFVRGLPVMGTIISAVGTVLIYASAGVSKDSVPDYM